MIHTKKTLESSIRRGVNSTLRRHPAWAHCRRLLDLLGELNLGDHGDHPSSLDTELAMSDDPQNGWDCRTVTADGEICRVVRCKNFAQRSFETQGYSIIWLSVNGVPEGVKTLGEALVECEFREGTGNLAFWCSSYDMLGLDWEILDRERGLTIARAEPQSLSEFLVG